MVGSRNAFRDVVYGYREGYARSHLRVVQCSDEGRYALGEIVDCDRKGGHDAKPVEGLFVAGLFQQTHGRCPGLKREVGRKIGPK